MMAGAQSRRTMHPIVAMGSFQTMVPACGECILMTGDIVWRTGFSGSFVYLRFTDVINMVTVIISWVYLCGAGCPVGSNYFAREPLFAEVPVRVLGVFLGNVTSFWSTFVLGGGVM